MKSYLRAPIVMLALALVYVASASAQWISITASHIQNSTGSGGLLATGQLCAQPVDISNHPLAVSAGGGGMILSTPACTPVVAGAISGFQLPDTSLTTPINACFRITVKDANGIPQIPAAGYNCVQPSSVDGVGTTAHVWCTTSGTTTCNLDLYPPSSPAQAIVAAGAPGPANSLVIGIVTQAAPGGSVAATITGSAPSQALNLTLPTGVQGPQGNPGAGQLTAAQVMPDTLAAQTTAYPSQATAIASVTDANAKTALTALNNSFLSLQAALQNNGITIPNSLQASIAACSLCGVYPFNPTGAATAPTTVSNVLAAGNTATFGVTFSTGQPNFIPGGRGPGQWGYIQIGNLGSGPVIALPASQIAGAATVSQGQLNITSTSQVQGGGALSTYFYSVPIASNTTLGTLSGTGGGTISVASMISGLSWTTGGAAPIPAFGITMTKTSDNGVGNGQCQEWNTATSAYVTYTFPTSYIANSATAVAPNSWNVTTLVDHGNGTWTCYLTDGLGSFASPLQTSTTSAVSAFAWKPRSEEHTSELQSPC